ncbi:MAG: hypothetical protein JWM59_4062 [Verrucomicrobiales bacterium]|nr:hypothetical protein [Verrucomicrobiales bacterium]
MKTNKGISTDAGRNHPGGTRLTCFTFLEADGAGGFFGTGAAVPGSDGAATRVPIVDSRIIGHGISGLNALPSPATRAALFLIGILRRQVPQAGFPDDCPRSQDR